MSMKFIIGRIGYMKIGNTTRKSLRFLQSNTRALLKPAQVFDIDLANPIETAVLLRILALLLFGPRRKKGRPLHIKKWTDARLFQLARDCEEVKKDHPKLSYARAAVAIKRRYPERYGDTSSEMMRQRLPKALSSQLEDADLDIPF
jgi:hypothetical protein